MASLRVLKGPKQGLVYELRPNRVVIGRKSGCGIVLNSDAVSREHAVLNFAEGRWYLEDLQSQNGTLLNGQRLTPGPAGRLPLAGDDRIEILGYQFAFDSLPAETPTPPLSGPADDGDDASIGLGQETALGSEVSSSIEVSEGSAIPSSENVQSKLATVLGIIGDLAQSIQLKDVLPKILDSLLRSFRSADRGYVLMRDAATDDMVLAVVRHRDGREGPPQISRTILDKAVETRSAILSIDAPLDDRFRGSESVKGFNLHSLMCAPLLDSSGNAMGAIQLNAGRGKSRFTNDDLDVLAGIARHVAIVIENSQLHDAAVRDVMEMNKKLRESEERFLQLAENINQVFWMSDLATGRLLYVSPVFDQLWGQPRTRLYDNPRLLLDSTHPEDQPRVAALADRQAEGRPLSAEYRIVRPDGSVRWIVDERYPIRDEAGRVYRVAGIAEDVTEQRRADEALRRAARLVSIGTLAAGIAHEINNPVAAALSSAETGLAVLDQGDRHEVVRECLQTIIESAQRCHRIVRDLLKFARHEPLVKERHCLNQIVERSRNLARLILERHGACVELDLAPGRLDVHVNALGIEQVLINLLQNAAQASDRPAHIKVSTYRRDAAAHVVVSDQGRGLTSDQKEHMFDPFFTTRQQSGGTGLGLSIVHGIVDEHHGTLVVDSTPGHGTTITVGLPLDGS